MCLNQQEIYNPRKKVMRSGYQRMTVSVPCGKCAECRDRRNNEWSFRSYWQCRYVFDNGGYRLFDTLTYKPELRPHISDFVPEFKNSIFDYPCFNYEHWKRFTIDLRNYLKRKCDWDPKDRLKYFCVTEYGTSDNGQHAPHIHVFFDVVDGSIDPVQLSLAINECWTYGRTDGLHYYRGLLEPWDMIKCPTVRIWKDRHVFGSDRFMDGIRISQYISKYMNKQSSFQKVIDNRMRQLQAILMSKWLGYEVLEEEIDDLDEAWLWPPELQDKIDIVKKHVQQFSKVSHHYGEYAMQFYDKADIAKNGYMIIPTDDKKFRYPVSNYYITKWFYEKYVCKDGRVCWRLRDDAKDYKRYSSYRNLKNLQDTFRMVLEQYAPDVYTKEELDKVYDKVEQYFGDRTYRRLAEYVMFYKGRLLPDNENAYIGHNKLRWSVPEVIELDILNSDPKFLEECEYKMLYVYATKTDRRHFGCKFVSDRWLGDVNNEFKSDEVLPNYYGVDYVERRFYGNFSDKLSYTKDLMKKCLFGTVNENTYPEFRDFDKLLKIIKKIQELYGAKKQAKQDETVRMQELFKYKNIRYKKR